MFFRPPYFSIVDGKNLDGAKTAFAYKRRSGRHVLVLSGDMLYGWLRILNCQTKGIDVPEKRWKTYEEVATYLLNQVAEHFRVGRFEGKQVIAGDSGTKWEIDAKGCSDGDGLVIVVECKRHTKSGISQAITGSLAYTIQDVDADGGILVSPLGLQAGAKKVAAQANIVEVVLNQESTTTNYMLSFLNQIHIGITDTVHVTDHLVIEIRGKDGNVVDRREH